jgi:hypothetical protein
VSPPTRAAAPPGEGGAGEQITEQVDRPDRSQGLRHREATCATCDDLRARPTIDDEWLLWGAGYRADARRSTFARELVVAS